MMKADSLIFILKRVNTLFFTRIVISIFDPFGFHSLSEMRYKFDVLFFLASRAVSLNGSFTGMIVSKKTVCVAHTSFTIHVYHIHDCSRLGPHAA